MSILATLYAKCWLFGFVFSVTNVEFIHFDNVDRSWSTRRSEDDSSLLYQLHIELCCVLIFYSRTKISNDHELLQSKSKACPETTSENNKKHKMVWEVRCPNGRASDSRARDRGFDPHSGRRVVSLSKIHLPPKKYW